MSSLSLACYVFSSTPAGKPQAKKVNDNVRHTANFPDKISTARFSSFRPDKQLCDKYAKEIKTLKEEVRKQIESIDSNTTAKLNLIDTVEKLGISYHFEREIEEQLNLIYSGNQSSEKNSDLGSVALQFRLFRKHGFEISSDIFDEFTMENGKFNPSLKIDSKNLLSLYEASHLRTNSDSILDEALIFARIHLSSTMQYSCPSMEKLVKHALQQPLHRGIPRVEAWHFISAYEDDRSKDESLLKLAKLDYNYLQIMYQEELATLIRWWKDFDLASKLPYGRDRLVVHYFWSLSMGFEPHYAMLRILVAKFFAVGTFIDDTYDAYGTIHELDLFTAAIERWDVNEVEQLPEYMKICLHEFFKINTEFEQFAVQQGRSYAFRHVKEAWKDYARCSNIQSKWFTEVGKLPSFEDYLNIAWVTCGVRVTAFMCFLAMESAREHMFDWLSHNPQILVIAGKLIRLQNDLASHKVRISTLFLKGNLKKYALEYKWLKKKYMKNYNVSEVEAEESFIKMYDDNWKHFNKEYCRKTKLPITRNLIESIINQIRILDSSYKIDEDGLTDPTKFTEPFLQMLLVDPFIV